MAVWAKNHKARTIWFSRGRGLDFTSSWNFFFRSLRGSDYFFPWYIFFLYIQWNKSFMEVLFSLSAKNWSPIIFLTFICRQKTCLSHSNTTHKYPHSRIPKYSSSKNESVGYSTNGDYLWISSVMTNKYMYGLRVGSQIFLWLLVIFKIRGLGRPWEMTTELVLSRPLGICMV